MACRISLTDAARRDLRDLPGYVRQRARRTVSALADVPRPVGSKELRGQLGVYRLRLEKWRITYRVDDEEATVFLLRVKIKTGPETHEDL